MNIESQNQYLDQQQLSCLQVLDAHKNELRKRFTLAKISVRPAKSSYERKREYHYWDYQRLELLSGLIETHYKTGKTVSFYSQQLKITPKTLNRLTSHVLGQTLYQLIQDRRLKESRVMLLDDQFLIKEIAYQLGFRNPAVFGRFFKELTGMTPRAFRAAANVRTI